MAITITVYKNGITVRMEGSKSFPMFYLDWRSLLNDWADVRSSVNLRVRCEPETIYLPR